jgi:hypothetical protein
MGCTGKTPDVPVDQYRPVRHSNNKITKIKKAQPMVRVLFKKNPARTEFKF